MGLGIGLSERTMACYNTSLCHSARIAAMSLKIGLTLVAFPLPIVIDDVLGLTLLAGGLIQRKIKNSVLYLEDVDKTFPDLVKELQEIKQEIL